MCQAFKNCKKRRCIPFKKRKDGEGDGRRGKRNLRRISDVLISGKKKQNTIVLFGGTSNGNRTHDFALRGQRLDRLTMEANGWGTRIRT